MQLDLLEELLLPDDFVIRERKGSYRFKRCVTESEIVDTAKTLLSRRVLKTTFMNDSTVAKDFFITQISALNCEVFCVAFLNLKHRVIACEQMFRGTLNESPVYPREVVHRALALNAAAVLFAHNHPSGEGTPSQSDWATTHVLMEALSLFNIKVLDHLVIAGSVAISFAEKGLLKQIAEKVEPRNYR